MAGIEFSNFYACQDDISFDGNPSNYLCCNYSNYSIWKLATMLEVNWSETGAEFNWLILVKVSSLREEKNKKSSLRDEVSIFRTDFRAFVWIHSFIGLLYDQFGNLVVQRLWTKIRRD
jgi:hypothetical protein